MQTTGCIKTLHSELRDGFGNATKLPILHLNTKCFCLKLSRCISLKYSRPQKPKKFLEDATLKGLPTTEPMQAARLAEKPTQAATLKSLQLSLCWLMSAGKC